MARNLRETIKELTRVHLEEKNGLIMGQCLSAVGWVDGTVPDTKGVVELPMTDVAGADFACGCAIAGRRPILVLRFGDFLLLNGNAIAVFAAKRKEVFGKSCPVFVRALSKEGGGTGNSHSGKLHSMFMHFPGLRLYCPITPGEYRQCWEDYMAHDDPAICFEHRNTFTNVEELEDVIRSDARMTLFAISYARMNAIQAVKILDQEGIPCNLIHIKVLKPLPDLTQAVQALRQSRQGLVVDTGYEICGAGRDIAYELTVKSGVIVEALGMQDKAVSCRKEAENPTPSAETIAIRVRQMVQAGR